MIRKMMVFMMLVLGVILVASGVAMSSSSAFREIKLGSADHGRVITCEIGDTILLSLESDPSTGYDWQVRDPVDDSVIRVTGPTPDPPSASSEGTGYDGTAEWRVEAVYEGEALLDLVYRRPGQANPETSGRFSLQVIVW